MADHNILIIDTNKEQVQKIASLLEAEGFICFSASSGESGIDMAKKIKPSLIFVNAAISVGMRGLEICKNVHEINELNDVPVIILTPRRVIITERDTNLYGIVDYLTFAFSAEELTSKTKDFLSRYRTEEIPEEKILSDEQQAERIPDAEQFEHTAYKDYAFQPDMSEIHPSDAGATEQVPEKIEKKVPDTVAREEEEDKLVSESSEEEPAEAGLVIPPLQGKDSSSEYQKKRFRNPVFLIALVTILIVITAGVILFYKDISHLSFFQKSRPATVQPPAPAEQQAVTIPPVSEIQKPQPVEESAPPPANEQPKPQPVEEKKPRVSREKQKTEVVKKVKPVLPATPLSEEKSVKKTIYSVQIGVFKDDANATSLAKKFESKGYHARVHTSKAKDQSPIHRVLIGRFENEKDAKKHAEKIHSGENIPVLLYKE